MRQLIILTSFYFYLFITPISALCQDIQESSQKNNELIILTYNVRNCRGLDNVTDYQRVADIISRINPGIVALQELDSATQRSSGIVVLNELADRTEMFPTYGASISFQGGKYGIGILSKEKPLVKKSVALPGREESRSLLLVEFKNYIFCCTHFSLNDEDRLKSAEIINTLFKESSKPVFLAGDLNTAPESDVIKTFETIWLLLSNPVNPTFPADNPRRTIDYILALRNSKPLINIELSKVEKEPVASDHLPLWVKVSFSDKKVP